MDKITTTSQVSPHRPTEEDTGWQQDISTNQVYVEGRISIEP